MECDCAGPCKLHYFPCNVDSFMYVEVLTRNKVKSKIEKMLGCDCWGVHVVDKDNKLIKVYFNTRDAKHVKLYHKMRENSDEAKVRDSLMKDATILMDDIQFGFGNRVVIVFGDTAFFEQHYYRVDELYIMNEIRHKRRNPI